MRSASILRDALSGWLTLAVNVAVSLVLTRMILHRLGVEELGAWRLLISVVGYYGVIDLALGAAVVRYLAKYRGEGRTDEFNATWNTALVSAAAFGAAFALLTAALASPLAAFLDVPEGQLAEFVLTIRVLGLSAAISAVAAIVSFVPISFHQLWISNGVRGVAELLRGGVSAALLVSGGGIVQLALTNAATTLLGGIVLAVVVRRWFREVAFSPRLFGWDALRKLVRFGAFAFLVKVGDLLRFQIGLMVVGRLIGLTAAGVYGVAVLLLRYVIMVVVSAGDTTQPRLAGIEADRSAFRVSLLEYARVVSVLAVGVVAVVFLTARDFLDLWLDADEVLAGGAVPALQILLVGLLPDLMTVVSVIGLRALNRHSWYAAQNLLEGGLNLALSIALVPHYGVLGVALGTAIPSLLMKLLVQPVYCCRLFGIPLGRYVRDVLILPLLPAALVIAPLLLLPALPPATSYLELAARALAFLALFGAISFFVSIGPASRRRLRSLLPRARSEAA